MGNSALEILVVPIFWTTFASCVAGAAILAAMVVLEAACSRVRRRIHYPPCAPRTPRRRSPRRIAGGLYSIG